MSGPRSLDGLGRVLRDLRIERGLTQAELSERARVSKSNLSLYETARRRPQIDTLEKLLEALGVTLRDLTLRVESAAAGSGAASARRGPRRPRPEDETVSTETPLEAARHAAWLAEVFTRNAGAWRSETIHIFGLEGFAGVVASNAREVRRATREVVRLLEDAEEG